jgi:hypothetical protein
MLDTSITADPASELAQAQKELALLEEQMREQIKAEQEEAARRVQGLGLTLQSIVDKRVSLRSEVEQRWLKNIRQINGVYEPEDFNRPKDSYGSRVYVPLTRRLRNMAVARLGDMLFPSDDRSFIIDPSPVAEMTEVGAIVSEAPPEAQVPGSPPGTQISDLMEAIKQGQKDAEIAASRMQRQIDDRLAEGRWPAKARRAIEDAVDLGTGVIKGPVPIRRRHRVWRVDPATGKASMSFEDKVVSTVEYVDLWNFYPDMSGAHVDECIDIAEAHHMSKKELRALREQPGFNAAAVDMILSSDPMQTNQNRRQDLRLIAGLSSAEDPRYCVWEYHGPINGGDLNACCHSSQMSEDEEATDQYDEKEDYSGVVWFCNGIVIKAIIQPLDSEQTHIYSVIWWQRDKSSIFGFGLPDEVRDQQLSANGSFRAMLDNMGLTVGPQIVFDDQSIVPVDGRWEISPFKMWRKTNPSADVRAAFGFYQTDSRIGELQSIFDKSKSLMDEVAQMPPTGSSVEQAPGYMNSATGAMIAHSTSMLWVRRFVRHWDDDMIEPLIGRLIDWEMDFNDDESIKGDHHAIPKGIGGLVELEGQGQRMTQFVQLTQQMGVPPRDQMRILRQFARSLKLDPDEILPTEEEIKQMPAQPADPKSMRIELQGKNAQLVHDAKMEAIQVKREELEGEADMYARREKLALMELASRERTTVEVAARKYGYDLQKLDREMANNDAARAHKSQMQNAEMAMKLRTGSGI